MFNGDIHRKQTLYVSMMLQQYLNCCFFFLPKGLPKVRKGRSGFRFVWSFQRSLGPGAGFKPRNSGGPFFGEKVAGLGRLEKVAGRF